MGRVLAPVETEAKKKKKRERERERGKKRKREEVHTEKRQGSRVETDKRLGLNEVLKWKVWGAAETTFPSQSLDMHRKKSSLLFQLFSPPSLPRLLVDGPNTTGEGKENERKTKQREKRNKLMQQIIISFPLTSTNSLIRKQKISFPPPAPPSAPFAVRVDVYKSDSLYKTNTSSRNAFPYGIHPNRQQTKRPDAWPRRAKH